LPPWVRNSRSMSMDFMGASSAALPMQHRP
jgi:hypothetical protein